jgi:hypothetical protein
VKRFIEKKSAVVLMGFLSLSFLSSCANYNAYALKTLSPSLLVKCDSDGKDMHIYGVSKPFNRKDCMKYLGRDVLAAGYMPVQIYIENNSSTSYIFDTNRISIACAYPEEVAEKVHTSTTGRVLAYGAAAVGSLPLSVFLPVTTPAFTVCAIVDGIKSSNANTALDHDYSNKSAINQTIQAYSKMNKIVFIPISASYSELSVTLIDTQTRAPLKIKLSAM